MKPAPFEYRRPDSLEEALELLAEHGDEAKPLAGGQSLLPLMNLRLARPAILVDLQMVPELRGVRAEPDQLTIGAMTTQAELQAEAGLPPAVIQAIPHIAHFQIRTRGTVGGSLAHMDPAAEWPALALLLDATLVVRGPRGQRELAAAGFMLAPLTTALDPEELLVAVRIPRRPARQAFLEAVRRPGDYALVGAAVSIGDDGAGVVAFATGQMPQRFPILEAALAGGLRTVPEIEALAAEEILTGSDIHASAGYRRLVGARLVARAVAACA